VAPGSGIAGRVLPVRHHGSVDVLLEAMGAAEQGDVLVVDNGGRTDEACVGDLAVLEARACGLSGMFVWGLHRDTAELVRIGFPVFSYGATPVGPRRLDPRDPAALDSASLGGVAVGNENLVFGDDDGVLFVPWHDREQVLDAARVIARTERRQAEAVRGGAKLWEQLRFDEYLVKRGSDPSYTFREHLRALGGAIEE
jgi:regulator of RNase E activity RraA